MWWVTSGVGSSLPASSSASTAVDVGDHVGLAEPQVEPLQPGEAEVHLRLADLDADPGDGAGVAGEADRRVDRGRRADRLDHDVGAAPAGRPAHLGFRVALGEVDRGGAELGRQLEPLLDRVDREDVGRAADQRRLHRAEPDRAEPQHRDRVAHLHPGVGDRVVAGPHHVAGEERRVGRHPLRHLAQDHVGEGDQRLVGLRPASAPRFEPWPKVRPRSQRW